MRWKNLKESLCSRLNSLTRLVYMLFLCRSANHGRTQCVFLTFCAVSHILICAKKHHTLAAPQYLPESSKIAGGLAGEGMAALFVCFSWVEARQNTQESHVSSFVVLVITTNKYDQHVGRNMPRVTTVLEFTLNTSHSSCSILPSDRETLPPSYPECVMSTNVKR